MADQQHYDKLKEGVKAWNTWRQQHSGIAPDLRNADLHGKALAQINFRRTNLDSANFYQADLSGANLRNAVLHRTYFKETILRQTNFHNAYLSDTLFLRVDLSETINLENAFHLGPSTIGIDTIQRSKGRIKDVFLRGAGVLEQLITSINSSGIAPFDYYTCFISYSSKDEDFVKKLYQGLRREGVFCWYAPESLKVGEKFMVNITEAVQSREKVLVVLSKDSLESHYVKIEVELVQQKEHNGKELLLPIRLDNAILTANLTNKVNWAAAIPDKRHIESFEDWQQQPSHSHYEKHLKALLKALRKQ